MKLLLILLAVVFMKSVVFAEGPIMSHKDTILSQEFDNVYGDLRKIRTSTTTLSAGSTNYIQNTTTAQSATFNVSSGTATAFHATASTITRINATFLTLNGNPISASGNVTYTIDNPGVNSTIPTTNSTITIQGSYTFNRNFAANKAVVLGTITGLASDLNVSTKTYLTNATDTTIQGLSGGQANQIVFFQSGDSSGSYTFVHNGSGTQKFLLPGSANLVIGPRGGAIFIFDGANWYCIGHTN